MVCTTDLPCSAARVLHLARIFGWKTSEKPGKPGGLRVNIQDQAIQMFKNHWPGQTSRQPPNESKKGKIHSCQLKLFCIFLRLAITLKCPCCFFLWYCCPVPSSLPRLAAGTDWAQSHDRHTDQVLERLPWGLDRTGKIQSSKLTEAQPSIFMETDDLYIYGSCWIHFSGGHLQRTHDRRWLLRGCMWGFMLEFRMMQRLPSCRSQAVLARFSTCSNEPTSVSRGPSHFGLEISKRSRWSKPWTKSCISRRLEAHVRRRPLE